jgi:hypothetical protein
MGKGGVRSDSMRDDSMGGWMDGWMDGWVGLGV